MGKKSTTSKRKYNEKAYDRIALTVAKGKKDIIRDIAEKNGDSINGFVNKAIDERIQKIEQAE